jgi:hypothetical protein
MNTSPNVTDTKPNATPEFTTEAARAFEEIKEEILAAATEDTLPVAIDVSAAVDVMLKTVRSIVPYREQLNGLSFYDADAANKLKVRAHALYWANGLHFWTLEGPGPVDHLVEDLRNYRKVLVAEVELMTLHGWLPANAVTLRGGPGFTELAQDVTVLGQVLMTNWSKLSERVRTERAYIHQALVTAEQLQTARTQMDAIKERSKSTAATRAAAWKLAYASYAEVERGIAFLRFHEDDAKTIAPSLFGRRGPKRGAKDDEVPANEPVIPAPIVDANGKPKEPNAPVNPLTPSKPF